MKYTIIGNGVAGTEAAISIRKHDLNGEITILSDSKHPFYYRPRLIDYLAGKVSLDDFTIYKSDFYQKKKIDCILDTHVEDLFPDEHMVVARDGTEYTYDQLLLATGAECFMLQIPGIDKKGVFKVRGVDDCDAI
ncbi:FAD-dependent oxidoreductase, partial [bacterium]|nr:FAD-dependent oxidoreductase [bacterium]